MRAVAGACVLAVGLPALSGGGTARGNPTDREVVFLPAGEGRTLAHGAGGWTASTQVTAVGCGSVGCPTLTAGWEPSIGLEAPGDGALRTRLSGLAGQSGTATATWRSPVVFVPAGVESTVLDASVRRLSDTPSSVVASSVTTRLVSLDGGAARTGVEGHAITAADANWTSGPAAAFPAGALPLGALYRIEVELTSRFDSRSSGVLMVDLDELGLRALLPRTATTFVPPALDQAAPETASSGALRPVREAPDAAPPSAAPLPGAALAACQDDEITIVGAAAARGRITVIGGTSRPPGTSVSLQDLAGSKLGTGLVDRRGLFRVVAKPPPGGERVRRVVARFADGEASPAAPVASGNVLRRVYAAGSRVAVEGTLSGGARARAVTVRLDRAATDACGAPQPLVSATAKVDARTGNYRALLRPPADPGARAGLATGGLFRAQVTTRSPGLPRRVTTSQSILVDASVISVH